MKQLEMLEMELKMMLENINRVRMFAKDHKHATHKPMSSHVFGELKHRSVTLKRRLTAIQELSTHSLF